MKIRAIALVSAATFILAFQTDPPVRAQTGQAPQQIKIHTPGIALADGKGIHEEYSTPDQVRDVGAPATSGETGEMLATTVPAAAAQAQALLPAGFVARPLSALRAGPGHGNPANAVPAKVISLYGVDYKGIPLAKGSDILTIVSASGRLLTTRRRNIPLAVDATEPRVSADAAAAAALDDAKRQSGAGDIAVPDAPQLQIWVDTAQQGHIAWDVVARSSSPVNSVAIEYWISALDGSILARENMIYDLYYGDISGAAWIGSPFQPPAIFPMPRAKIASSLGLPPGYATASGAFLYSRPFFFQGGTLTTTLTGTYAAVTNYRGPGMTVSSPAMDSTDITMYFDAASDTDLAQVSAYYWVDFAHVFADSLIGKDQKMNPKLLSLPTIVNLPPDSVGPCNGQWVGGSLHFYAAGSSRGYTCPNTAYSDVVLHEFGHAVDWLNGGIVDSGYSEGFGDALSMLGTRQSCVGRDFFGPGTCLRDGKTVVTWPSAMNNTNPHVVGQPYGEFVWALLQNLRQIMPDDDAFALTKQLTFLAASGNPSSVPDAVYLTFKADDDDGNLANCTPHFLQIAQAAASRQLPYPGSNKFGVLPAACMRSRL